MSDVIKSWTDQWAATQQAFLKTLFPTPSTRDATASAAKSAMQAQFEDMQETWKESIEKWTAFAKDIPNAPVMTPDALREIFAPGRWGALGAGALDAGLRHVVEGPKYATLSDLDRKLTELQQLALRRDKDLLAFQSIVQKAWNNAFNRFASTFGGKADAAPTTWRSTADRWISVANDALIDTNRSPEFVEAQRRMMRSASDYRLQERKLAEAWCEACHIPTRSEMDEMQRTVTELRRQLRTQQRRPPMQLDAPAPAAPARKSKPSTPRPRRAAPV